jgi:hypothetical protein
MNLVEHELRRQLRGREDLASPEQVEELREEIDAKFRRDWIERTDRNLSLGFRPLEFRRYLTTWQKAWLVQRMGKAGYERIPW